MKEYVCECGRIFTTPQSYSGHRTRCETNPNNHRVFICEYCGKHIKGLHSYNKHTNYCYSNPDRKVHIVAKSNNEYTCNYCGNTFRGLLSLKCHERLCSSNPNRAENNLVQHNNDVKTGNKLSWNKGLTKNDHPSIKSQSEKLTGRVGVFTGKHHSAETKQHLSKVQTEIWHNDAHHRTFSKSGWYDNQYMMSTYELAYFIYTKETGHKITRCNRRFPYIYEGKKHYYYPDFIVDDSIIVEIKGFETDLDRVKYTLVPELVVLRYADIKHCIEYVQSKYNVSELSELYAAV